LEINNVPDVNTNEQLLKDQNSKLEKQLETLHSELEALKSKGSEATISALRADLAARDLVVADKDKTIAGLNTQVAAITESSATLTKRLEATESSLATASEQLAVVKSAETRRSREAMLREKKAPAEVIAGLIEQLAILDNDAFSKTIDTISASWAKPTAKVKSDPVVKAVNNAKADEDPPLATTNEDESEETRAAVVEFMSASMKQGRTGGRSVYASSNSNGDA